MMFFPRKQSHNVLVVRRPRKDIDCQNTRVRPYHVCVDRYRLVSQNEHDHLHDTQPRNPDKRAERAHFRNKNDKHDHD